MNCRKFRENAANVVNVVKMSRDRFALRSAGGEDDALPRARRLPGPRARPVGARDDVGARARARRPTPGHARALCGTSWHFTECCGIFTTFVVFFFAFSRDSLHLTSFCTEKYSKCHENTFKCIKTTQNMVGLQGSLQCALVWIQKHGS